MLALKAFLKHRRVLYAAPTEDQIGTFWYEIKRALQHPIDAGGLVKNETKHLVEVPGTKTRIRAKTAFNADTLRGDYADLLILDEWQLMDEDAWELVGAPMLLDNDGDAVFIYTPPSLHSKSVSKARDPRHAAKMFRKHQDDQTGRWACFHFRSSDNPHISAAALEELVGDMTALAIRQEIQAEDVDEVPGALWNRALLDRTRFVPGRHPDLERAVLGVDPPGGATECGLIVAGVGWCACRGPAELHGFVTEDASLMASPDAWASVGLSAYARHSLDRIVGEANYGGDMVESTFTQAARARGMYVAYKPVQATRGKAVRAEPVVALFEQSRVHLVGDFPALEDELCGWVPGVSKDSPNRLDAMVWAITELLLKGREPGDYGVSI